MTVFLAHPFEFRVFSNKSLVNMVWLALLLCCIAISSSLHPNKHRYHRKHRLRYLRSLNPTQLAETVKNEFVWGYNAYKQYAWGCDELFPKSKDCHNYYNVSLMWTPIDSLDTMYLMNLTDLLDDTLELLCNTPFNGQEKFSFAQNQDVFVFDYFLRSLGGILYVRNISKHI